jgi:hypothetical protein
VAGAEAGICPNKDLVVAARVGPEVAAVEAGAAAVDLAPNENMEVTGAAVVGAPNFSVGAADCAVAGGCEADVLEGGWLKRFVVADAVAGVAVGVPKSVFCADGCGAFEERAPNGLGAFDAADGAPKDSVGVDAGASVDLSCAKRPPPEVTPPATAPKRDGCWVPLVVGGVADGVVEAAVGKRDFCAAGVADPNSIELAGLSSGFLFSVPEGAPNESGLVVLLGAPKSPVGAALPAVPKRLLEADVVVTAVADGVWDADGAPNGLGAWDADDGAPNGLGAAEPGWVNWNGEGPAMLESG